MGFSIFRAFHTKTHRVIPLIFCILFTSGVGECERVCVILGHYTRFSFNVDLFMNALTSGNECSCCMSFVATAIVLRVDFWILLRNVEGRGSSERKRRLLDSAQTNACSSLISSHSSSDFVVSHCHCPLPFLLSLLFCYNEVTFWRLDTSFIASLNFRSLLRLFDWAKKSKGLRKFNIVLKGPLTRLESNIAFRLLFWDVLHVSIFFHFPVLLLGVHFDYLRVYVCVCVKYRILWIVLFSFKRGRISLWRFLLRREGVVLICLEFHKNL